VTKFEEASEAVYNLLIAGWCSTTPPSEEVVRVVLRAIREPDTGVKRAWIKLKGYEPDAPADTID
jgi:hypothetical protein